MLTVRRTTLAITATALLLAAVSACDPATTTTTPSKAASKAAVPAASNAASAPAAAVPAGDGDKLKDIEIVSCQVDSTIHWPSADLKITNHTSKSSNYMVTIEFVDGSGTRLAEGLAATNNLAAGQAATVKAAGTAEVKGSVSCRVVDVTRYAAM
jgi:hypothetical protein